MRGRSCPASGFSHHEFTNQRTYGNINAAGGWTRLSSIACSLKGPYGQRSSPVVPEMWHACFRFPTQIVRSFSRAAGSGSQSYLSGVRVQVQAPADSRRKQMEVGSVLVNSASEQHLVPGAGIEPARTLPGPRDFKSRVSTKFHHPGGKKRIAQNSSPISIKNL